MVQGTDMYTDITTQKTAETETRLQQHASYWGAWEEEWNEVRWDIHARVQSAHAQSSEMGAARAKPWGCRYHVGDEPWEWRRLGGGDSTDIFSRGDRAWADI